MRINTPPFASHSVELWDTARHQVVWDGPSADEQPRGTLAGKRAGAHSQESAYPSQPELEVPPAGSHAPGAETDGFGRPLRLFVARLSLASRRRSSFCARRVAQGEGYP